MAKITAGAKELGAFLVMDNIHKGKLFLCIREPDGELIKAGLSVYSHYHNKLHADTVEVVPLYKACDSVDSYEEWLLAQGLEDTPQAVRDFCFTMVSEHVDELDAAWKASLGQYCVFMDPFFIYTHENYGPAKKPIHHDFMTPDSLVHLIQEPLLKRLPEGTEVFVSPQIILANEFKNNSVEFFRQGRDRLVYNERYFRHRYDVQDVRTGEEFLPLYCVPVSIRISFPRVFPISEYASTIEKIEAPLFDEKALKMNYVMIGRTAFSFLSESLICPGQIDEVIHDFHTDLQAVDEIIRRNKNREAEGLPPIFHWDFQQLKKELAEEAEKPKRVSRLKSILCRGRENDARREK